MLYHSFKILFAAFIGTVLEWYDFMLFALLAPFLAPLFFPAHSQLASFLMIYSVFAVSFLMRPCGAFVLGYYGDRIGRKSILIYCMRIMAGSTLLIGLLPTYQTIGLLAPILLVLLRLIQGFCIGGETTGALSFSIESFPDKQRGLIGSFAWSAVGIGMLLSSLAVSLLTTYLSPRQISQFGWRAPFLFGIATAMLGYYFRKHLPETPLFLKKSMQAQYSLVNTLLSHKKQLSKILGLYGLSAMITYLIFIFMPTYAVQVAHISWAQANLISTIGIGCVTLFMPFAGLLSDRIGRRPCLLISAGGFLLLSYPLYVWMTHDPSMRDFMMIESCFMVLAIFYQGTLSTAVQEMTETSARYTVTAVGYHISYALFGGLAPLFITYATHLTGLNTMPGVLLSLGGLMAMSAVLGMKETAKMPLN